jgi:hypothetical protein
MCFGRICLKPLAEQLVMPKSGAGDHEVEYLADLSADHSANSPSSPRVISRVVVPNGRPPPGRTNPDGWPLGASQVLRQTLSWLKEQKACELT